MSVQALSAVLEESQARLGNRLVLIAIANHANEIGEKSFPNLETLAREANLSVRQVIRCIQELEALGELVVLRVANKPNRYRIQLSTLRRGDKLSRDKSGPEMSREPSGTKKEVKTGSGDKSRRGMSRARLSLPKWQRQGCSNGYDWCDRVGRLCTGCERERQELVA